MPMPPKYQRRFKVQVLKDELSETGFPRLQMLLLVALTGGAGFLVSFLMLKAGMTSMAVRYPLAVGVAYGAFLLLLWVWLRTSSSDYSVDDPGLQLFGGDNGGTARVADPGQHLHAAPAGTEVDVASESTGVTDVLGDVGDLSGADELAIPLLLLAVVGVLLFSSVWVVYTAPALFAELLVDGALSASLYHRLQGLESRHWLTTAIGKTVWPFVITAGVVSFSGWLMHHQVPTAHSLGQVVEAWRSTH